MKLTEKIKQIGKKAAPYALAVAVALGSYGCGQEKAELPIYPKVRDSIVAEQNIEYEAKQREIDSALEEMTNNYNSTLDLARNKFNEYVAQRDTFTVDEQEKVLDFYEKAREIRKGIRNYAEDNGRPEYSNLAFPKEDFQLYLKLDGNLNNADFGEPNLENSLKDKGIDIEVQSKTTSADAIWSLLGIICAGTLGLATVKGIVSDNRFRKRLREKEKTRN